MGKLSAPHELWVIVSPIQKPIRDNPKTVLKSKKIQQIQKNISNRHFFIKSLLNSFSNLKNYYKSYLNYWSHELLFCKLEYRLQSRGGGGGGGGTAIYGLYRYVPL